MAIQDVLTTIKDYFLDWHGQWNPNGTDNYEKAHRLTDKITTDLPDSEYSIRSKAIAPLKATTENEIGNAKTRLTNLENGKVDKGIYANVGGTNGLASYQADWRGFNPKASGDCHDGLMRWQDKAQLLQLGIWYEVNRAQHASIGEHMTLWVNPAMRICYLKFYYKNFPVKRWDNITSNGAEWDWYEENLPDQFLDNCAPISNIWAATNVPHIVIGIDSTARFYIRSSKKITKPHNIYASLFWFYQDDNIYSRWTK